MQLWLTTATLRFTEVVVYWLPDLMTKLAALGMQDAVRIKVSRDSPRKRCAGHVSRLQNFSSGCKNIHPARQTQQLSAWHGMSECLGSKCFTFQSWRNSSLPHPSWHVAMKKITYSRFAKRAIFKFKPLGVYWCHVH